MEVKEAVQAGAPRAPNVEMPQDDAERVVEGARHMSPFLGDGCYRLTFWAVPSLFANFDRKISRLKSTGSPARRL